MKKAKERRNGLYPSKGEKQRVDTDRLKRASRYNYKVMNEDVSHVQDGFAQNLAALRSHKGISAREMSLSLGQGSSYINDIENGRALPSIGMFFEICEYLGVTPYEFFEYVADDKRDIIEEIIQNLKELSREDQLLILKLSESMQKKK